MQVNSVNNLGSTSFGNRAHKSKKDCPSCNPNTDNSMVSVPRPLYNKLLGMAMLAMVAGGPVAMTSCSTMNPPENPTETTNNPKTPQTNPNTYVTGADSIVVTTPTVSSKLTDMANFLGLNVKSCDAFTPTDVIKNDDVIEFGYHEDAANTDYKLDINKDLTTKDTRVFDGTSIDNKSGNISYIRYEVASADGGTVVKKLSTKYGKPISENSGWNTIGTFKYVTAPDGIKEYSIKSDSSEQYVAKYVPKNGKTVSRVYENGDSQDLSNVSVTKLEHINTGLHDVYM